MDFAKHLLVIYFSIIFNRSSTFIQYFINLDIETKRKPREKFVELAEKRVSRVIKDLRLVGNLSNRSNYSYTQQDVRKIIATLKSELDALKARFDTTGSDSKHVFKL